MALHKESKNIFSFKFVFGIYFCNVPYLVQKAALVPLQYVFWVFVSQWSSVVELFFSSGSQK